MKRLCWALILLLCAGVAAASTRAQVKATSGLSGVRVEATQVLQVDARTLWETLTDYNRLASFVPDMISSRVVSPPGAPKRVEQIADAGMFAFIMPDQVVLAMEEAPPNLIRFRAVSGKLVSMNGEWRIIGDRVPVTLMYRAHIVPLGPIPPLGSGFFVEDEVRSRFEAVGREAERRMREQAARSPLFRLYQP